MASLHVYYKNGNYEEFSPTTLPFGDGYLIQNDFIKVDNIEDEGIIWERSFFATEAEDPDGVGGTIRQFQLIKPEDLFKIEAIMINNTQQIYPLTPPTDEIEENHTPFPSNELTVQPFDSSKEKMAEDTTTTDTEEELASVLDEDIAPHDEIDKNDLEELFANLAEE